MRNRRKVRVGNVFIGGDSDISVQSMLNVDPLNVEKNIEQAKLLESVGCDIIRIAVPNKDAVRLIYKLKCEVSTPIVADIHFDYRIAIESVNAGVDKIRLNPGNIGDDSRVKAVADSCRQHSVPIRIGVNSGSLEKSILEKYGEPTAEALCESALHHASLLEKFDFNDIVLSMKSSNVITMVNAYRLAYNKCNYPLHLGVTEAGTKRFGIIKSSCGIGALLIDGIGDTIRVSLTADPVEEIYAAKDLLKVLGLKKGGIEIISCPTCGRTKINLIPLAMEAEKKLKDIKKDLKVAIMGCAVNGPGEAREADIGIAGGDGVGLIFKKGKIIKKVEESKLLDELVLEIEKM